MRNLLAKVPRHAQPLVATLVRSVFEQPGAEHVRAWHARVVDELLDRFADAAVLLDDAREEILAFTAFPPERWRQIWSNNPQERLNREIRPAERMLSAYSPTGPLWSASSGRCSPSRTTSGPRPDGA
jgi:transposase-like protein